MAQIEDENVARHVKRRPSKMMRVIGSGIYISMVLLIFGSCVGSHLLEIQGPKETKAGGYEDYSTTMCSGMNYQWKVKGGSLISGQGSPKVRIRWDCNGTHGEVSVAGSGGSGKPPCGGKAKGALPVAINYLDEALLVIKGPTNVCESKQYNYQVPDYKKADSYKWTAPHGSKILSLPQTHSTTIEFGAASGNVEVVPQPDSKSYCPNTKASLPVKVIPPLKVEVQ